MEARWGKHEYHYTDQKGRPQKKVKRWFGYSVNGIFGELAHERIIAGGAGVDFPCLGALLERKYSRHSTTRCAGSDIRHVKAGCGIDCGCSVPAHEPNNFAKREASSLFADAEGRNMPNKFNKLPDKFN